MSGSMRWDDYLVAEHELIERAMAVLRTCLEKVQAGTFDVKQLSRSLDFLLSFGDRVHNQKEELFLFPLMEKRGIPSAGGPLGVMVREHAEERDLLARMLTVVGTLAQAAPATRMRFVDEGEAYLKIRAEHIWKENDVLYAMGRKVLTPEDNDFLLREFAGVNEAAYGAEAESHYADMVAELEKGSAVAQRLVERLSYAQLHAILEALPFELTFVDAADSVAYFNRLDKAKVFTRTRSVIGRKVQKCHPEKSVDTVQRIVDGFKDRTLENADFWIDFKGDKILIRYFPVYGEAGEYLGVVEVTQEIGWIQKLSGQKRLLD
jgi:DUF438 domain-containing protein